MAATARLRDILRRELPRTSARRAGEPLQAGAFDLEQAKEVAAGLDDSYLFIQGPPGSGKTYARRAPDRRPARARRAGRRGLQQPRGDPQPARRGRALRRESGSSSRGLKKSSRARTRCSSRELDEPSIENSDDNERLRRPATCSWSPAPPGCSRARRWTARSTTCSSTRPGRSRWPTRSRSAPPRATSSCSATRCSSPRSRRRSIRPGPGASVLEHLLGDETHDPAPTAACSSTRRAACTPTSARSSRRRSTRAGSSRSRTARGRRSTRRRA